MPPTKFKAFISVQNKTAISKLSRYMNLQVINLEILFKHYLYIHTLVNA